MGGDQPREGPPDDAPVDGAREAVARPDVLVVDDEDAVRAWVRRVLERSGVVCVGAASGPEALRLVADDRVRPSVLLTEIEMSGMTGIELAARLLSLRPMLRVVMMTADPVRAAAARSRPSIVATVLLKPIDAADLVDAIGLRHTRVAP